MGHIIRNLVSDVSLIIVAMVAFALVGVVWSYFDNQSLAPSLRFLDPRVEIQTRTVTPNAVAATDKDARTPLMSWRFALP